MPRPEPVHNWRPSMHLTELHCKLHFCKSCCCTARDLCCICLVASNAGIKPVEVALQSIELELQYDTNRTACYRLQCRSMEDAKEYVSCIVAFLFSASFIFHPRCTTPANIKHSVSVPWSWSLVLMKLQNIAKY